MASGRRILVVGGGLGIGQKVTQYLLQHHTAKVVVFGLHVAPELGPLASTGRLHIVQGDATSDAARAQAREAVLEFMGGIDTLVITVGVMGEIQRLGGMSSVKLLQTYSINVFAPMLMCQTFLPELRKTRGDIIILSSTVDKNVKYAGWIQYCSSKAALTRFIQVLAHEESDVKVHGVYPGLTKTTMPAEIIAGKFTGIMTDDEVQKFRNWDKLGEIEPPEWCANAVAKLAARDIPVWTNGVCRYYYEYDPDCRNLRGSAQL
ncbi:hypothetical protein A1O1_02773 [Capronia coronata CBS 617.96]|uniref:Uncharacterized protein n=1 Tax=Capronia coronata CBS 617.96 TaxID=1182541 RepID=W9ZIT0_9EURO|nr:uncharacterized protein A1O1_02773 [Capronia coronata CBS 617.96]EXJ94379.1 hypothetical protein A1O1_02773 [Capronia coronata CBS 617.96]